jgi:hypothetical protein
MFFQVPVKAVVFAVGNVELLDATIAKMLAGPPCVLLCELVNLRLLPAMVPFEATLLVVVFQAIVMLPTSWCAAPAVAPKT